MPTKTPNKLLVTRFSSLGDVAMLVPVLQQLALQYPEVEITVLSNNHFEPLFANIPRLSFHGVSMGQLKTLKSLSQLAQVIKKENFNAWADMHGSLRTQILKFLLIFNISHIKTIQKGREEKKLLTRQKNKLLTPLKSTHERYADVLRDVGFTTLQLRPSPNKKNKLHSVKKIGIAPFAKFKEKTYPLHKMQKVAQKLAAAGHQIFLFGGAAEQVTLTEWATYPGIKNVAGTLSFEHELELITDLDLMISMDSANMHLAALVGTPCLSIWGATHPYAGFLGFAQTEESVVQNNVACRPCSVFGNKPCWRGDNACLNLITEESILAKVHQLL